jgi:hypothetical protein
MYNLERAPWMQRAAEDTQLFQVIRIDGKKLRYEARTARGTLYDAFTLTKSKGKPNKLQNDKLTTPENIRSAEHKAELAREAAERKAAEEKKKSAK